MFITQLVIVASPVRQQQRILRSILWDFEVIMRKTLTVVSQQRSKYRRS
jgi:hypothetical protein